MEKSRYMYSAVPATAMRDVLQRRIELFETDPDAAEYNTIEDLLELADKYQVEQIVDLYGHYKQLNALRQQLVQLASSMPSDR
ncbi:hypothetical protein C0Q70_15754 [Pomacea canaliculata]|uniref:Uncharacterized protein n=1 Tax=Pomacea canaliculata TaxID=400727 RepID=A0A2T7NVS8_POMCA|nr:hypothetical protein C0Q70_15754 [Pomacea canaliculata]